jgi:hypothetical protein
MQATCMRDPLTHAAIRCSLAQITLNLFLQCIPDVPVSLSAAALPCPPPVLPTICTSPVPTTPPSGPNGRTALHIAVSRSSKEAAELLLSKGADINCT